MSETIPEPWASLFRRAGITSQRHLTRETGVSPSTINRLIRGMGKPDSDTVRLVADALTDGDTRAIWEAAGTGQFDYGDFDLTDVSHELRMLTPKQRRAVIAIIRAMAEPERADQKAGEEHENRSASMNQGGDEVAERRRRMQAETEPVESAARKRQRPAPEQPDDENQDTGHWGDS